MIGYLDRLKALDSGKCLPSPLQKLQKDPSYSCCSTQGGRFQKITPIVRPDSDTATASRWWRLHYPNREPLEVATFPPASHAEILERHPEAIAAEPFDLAEPERACSTCAHRPPGLLAIEVAPCGDPIAAGLSEVEGVIRHHPGQGATCPAWLATIPGDLEARSWSMAERWGHSGDDLALVLDAARQDPEGWLRMLEVNERGGTDNGK
jgi:hypothetical protein